MAVFSWLFSKAADTDAPVPRITPAVPRKTMSTPDPNKDHDEAVDAKGAVSEIDLDEVFAAIEYEDSHGNETRRRITMQKLIRGPTSPILRAICHERHAVRNFRTDRIECFITADGEVIETEVFFRNILGIELRDLGPDQTLETARYLRERLRAPLSILMAAALSDGELHLEELDVIQRYAEDHIAWMERTDRMVRGFDDPVKVNVTIAHLDLLNGMIANMRPQRRSLKNYLIRIMEFEPEPFDRLLRALEAVIVADGVLHPDELEFLEEMSKTRHPVTGAGLGIEEWG